MFYKYRIEAVTLYGSIGENIMGRETRRVDLEQIGRYVQYQLCFWFAFVNDSNEKCTENYNVKTNRKYKIPLCTSGGVLQWQLF